MRKATGLFLFASLSASPSGFAVSDSSKAQTMSLADLKAKCAELSADEQLKPFKALVSCKQTVKEWRPVGQAGESLMIENTKEIGASFSLKGYAVPFQSEEVAMAPAAIACQIYEQVQISVPAVDLDLSCDALTKVDKLSDLCAPAIEERIKADPGIQQIETTGKTFNTCQGR